MQNVGKGLGMHQAMLDRDVNDVLRGLIQDTVQFLANFAIVAVDFFERRPVGGLI